MSEANKALVRRWFEEVWNQGREETIDELFAAHGIGYGLGDTEAPVHGPAGIKPFVRNLRGALPDIHMKIEDSIAEGDKVTVRITVEGTHKGGQLGVAPTGRRIRIEGSWWYASRTGRSSKAGIVGISSGCCGRSGRCRRRRSGSASPARAPKNTR